MLNFLHITRTGGCARRFGLLQELQAGNVMFWPHEKTLIRCPSLPVVYVREPLDRYGSQWSSFGYTIRRNGPEYDYADVDAFTEDFDNAIKNASPRSKLMWRPQTYWVNTKLPLYLLRLDTMDDTYPALLERHGLVGKLPSLDMVQAHHDIPAVLNEATQEFVREKYARDFELYDMAHATLPPI